MPCYNCSAEFGFMKKEVGCENCGFSFCSRCCKKQAIGSENADNKKMVICNKCILKLTSSGPSSSTKDSPPLAHKKRMEALKKQSFSVDSETHARLKSQWSNEKDKALAERLQRLKRDRIKNLPSEDEIAERLAILKGMDPAKYNAPPIQVFRPSEKRTSIEQANDLMQQVTEEVNLDSQRVKPEDEIAARLAALRNEPPKVGKNLNIDASDSTETMDVDSELANLQTQSRDQLKGACQEVKILNTDTDYQTLLAKMQQEKEMKRKEMSASDEENEEMEADKLVKKLLESTIDDDMEGLDSLNDTETDKSNDLSKQPSEEFPWCVICTEDAKIRCFGCDQDLYCMRCFKECHDSLDIRDHKTCPYLPPKSLAL